MNWLNVLILASVVLFVFKGIKRGMIRSAFSLISLVLTLVFASVLNPYMVRFLMSHTPIYQTVQEKCAENISDILEEKLKEQGTKEEEEQLIATLPLPGSMKKILTENNHADQYQHLLAESFGEYLSHSIAEIAIGSISLMFTFILVSMFMSLLAGMLDGIFSLPGLSLLNRAGGAVIGVVQGVFFVWICFLVITLFWDTPWAQEAVLLIRENRITDYLYENNILMHFLSGML